jgi:glucan 1,4-alpha-glucosidase
MKSVKKLAISSAGAILLAGLTLSPGAFAAVPAGSAPVPASAPTPYWTVGRNDAIVTADDTASKVWFDLQRGAIGETYYPNITTADSAQMQFVVVHNGKVTPETEMTHQYALVHHNGLAVVVVNTPSSGDYALTHLYYTNPNNNSIVVRTWFTVLKGTPSHYQLYVFSHPQLSNQGDGNSASTETVDSSTMLVSTNTNSVGTVAAALASATGFLQTSNGYMGSSDGLTQLEKTDKLVDYSSATDGDVAQIGELALTPMKTVPSDYSSIWPSFIATDAKTTYTSEVVLAYGSSPSRAEDAATQTLASSWAALLNTFEAQWAAYLKPLYQPTVLSTKLQDEYWLALMTLKGAEDKTFRGAMAASLTTPWGEDESAADDSVTGYHMVWVRDAYQMASAFLAAGDVKTAEQILNWYFTVDEEPNGNYPQNSYANGTPNWTGQELDQNGFPIILAWQLRHADPDAVSATDFTKYMEPDLRYILNHGPWTDLDRWEEASGFSPNTMAVDIAALALGARIAQKDGFSADAAVYRGAATRWLRHVSTWAVTDDGPYSKSPYFVRISTGPNVNGNATITLANGGGTYPQKDIIDAGFLSLVRLGLLPANDPLVRNSLQVVDNTIEVQTPNGPGFHRYNHDGYGNYENGAPYNGSGVGGLWPVLDGERGEYELAAQEAGVKTAETPLFYLQVMDNMAYGLGMVPEQVWPFDTTIPPSPPGTNPATASIGLKPGVATGSAAPLDWAMAQYVRLAVDISKNQLVDQPHALAEEFADAPAAITTLPLSVSFPTGSVISPVPTSGPDSVDTADVSVPSVYADVTGTTSADSDVTVGVVNSSGLKSFAEESGANGAFSIATHLNGGTNTVYVTSQKADGSSATKTYIVTAPPAPPHILASWTNLPFDDLGPGWYEYPTGTWFEVGKLDMTAAQVGVTHTQDTISISYDKLNNVYDGVDGFSNKLIEVYLVKPGSTSTSADSLPYANVGFAPGSKWTYALRVSGFGGNELVNAAGTVLATDLGVSTQGKTVTIRIPQSLIGTFAPGWGFVITALSQDGYAPGCVSTLNPSAGEYNFGYVKPDPIQGQYPTNVMDVVVPSGTPQEALDYLTGPIELHAVRIPPGGVTPAEVGIAAPTVDVSVYGSGTTFPNELGFSFELPGGAPAFAARGTLVKSEQGEATYQVSIPAGLTQELDVLDAPAKVVNVATTQDDLTKDKVPLQAYPLTMIFKFAETRVDAPTEVAGGEEFVVRVSAIQTTAFNRTSEMHTYALPPTLTFLLTQKNGHAIRVVGHAKKEDLQPNVVGSTFVTAYDVVAPSVTTATYVRVQIPSDTLMDYGSPWNEVAPNAPLEYLAQGPRLYIQPGPPVAQTPEVPLAGLLPLALAVGGGGYVWWRRRKSRP